MGSVSFFHITPPSSSTYAAFALPGKYDLLSSIQNIIFKTFIKGNYLLIILLKLSVDLINKIKVKPPTFGMSLPKGRQFDFLDVAFPFSPFKAMIKN